MKKEIVLKNTIVTLLAIIIFAFFSAGTMEGYAREQATENIESIAAIYYKNFEFREDGNYTQFITMPETINKTTRLTVIDSTGKVLADSIANPAEMDNHFSREEIAAATEGKFITVIRKSDTLGIKMIYCAVKISKPDLSDFIILRVSSSAKDFWSYMLSSLPALTVITACVVAFSVFITIRLNRSVITAFKSVEENLKKINDGTYKSVMPNFRHRELNRAIIGLNDIQQKINDNISRLHEQTEKLDSVLANIEQGILTLDSEMNVMLINAYAFKIFDLSSDVTGKNLLYTGCSKELYDNISKAMKGQGEKSFETELRYRIYSVTVSSKSDSANETIVIFADITTLKKMENTRSDFFANASHELKTPITSIVGFSELLELENNPESIKKYTSYIIKDSRRMLRLIEDMLKLSKLDVKIEQGKKQNLELLETAKEVKEALAMMAYEKDITVNISGNARLFANKDNMYELLENLVSNAIRYNNERGKVDINIYNVNKKAVLEVIDNGIGIDKIHQDRIFERFYRVDKSRSKSTGGTGLGLSIVKHIVSLYGGTIELESRLGEGTKIKVIL